MLYRALLWVCLLLPAGSMAQGHWEKIIDRNSDDLKEATSLAVFFTDGRSKFYKSTPKLELLDTATGKVVKSFYRTIDESGNPDPQPVMPGTYNLRVAGRESLLMRHIEIAANKKNKITVRVKSGSLRFEYYHAPKRRVTEYEALVNIRFEPGPTVRQRCNQELEYLPGSYYIEVNTMPITRFNVDIDFGATSVVYINEPGYARITGKPGVVALYFPLGDRFVHFHDLRISGEKGKKLSLKPGTYEAHWTHDGIEKITRFEVESNAVTAVALTTERVRGAAGK